ncbi:MAG: hypothetical protein ABR558_06840 [Thioalkalivibrio sp.]
MKTTFDVDEGVWRELCHIVDLHEEHGAPCKQESLEDLINYVLSSIADGSRRPGSWERQMLESMGLAADCEEHQVYRAGYGPGPEVGHDDR